MTTATEAYFDKLLADQAKKPEPSTIKLVVTTNYATGDLLGEVKSYTWLAKARTANAALQNLLYYSNRPYVSTAILTINGNEITEDTAKKILGDFHRYDTQNQIKHISDWLRTYGVTNEELLS